VTSTDGRHWSPIPDEGPFVSDDNVHDLTDVAATSRGFVIIGGGGDAPPAAWTSPDGLHWTRASSSNAFGPGDNGGYGMAAIAVDPDGIVAVGGSPHADAFAVWTSTDGVAWQRSDRATVEPDAQGRFGIAGVTPWHGGFVAVGTFPNLDPVGGWSASVWQSPPPETSVSPPEPVACAHVKADLGGVVSISPADRVRCFAHRTISFRAWPVALDYGQRCAIHPLPTVSRIRCGQFLAPAPGIDVYWIATGFDPRASRRGLVFGHEYRVTGHFDDPTARRCDPASIAACRAVFVVTQYVKVH
jgi:hypothetical protein